MRILHVVEATGGGVRRHLQLVLPGLRARGHEVALAYSLRRADPGFSQDLAQFEAAGIVLREIPMRRLPAPADRAAARKVAEFATDFGAEIMHCHGTKAGILGRMQRRIRPVVYSPHAFLFQGATGFKRILLLMLENMFVRQTAALICVSEAEEQVARAADLRFAKVAIARNGVPITSPANPAGFAEFAIGCAARLAPQKGIDVLIRALGQVPGARLTLWGDGPLLAELQALAVAEGVADRVDFAGFAEDAREQVKNMDLGVLPSRFEGLSYQLPGNVGSWPSSCRQRRPRKSPARD